MDKKAFFFIDDVIWVLRDITKEKPSSIYDNGFMKMLKNAHDDSGFTVQLNLFYRTDFFYGSDEFTLADVTDAYKEEFQAAKSWLRFAFHGKQEFPDYPYVNAKYEDVKKDYEAVAKEILRFAGEGMISDVMIPHWLPISKAGCQALKDCGIRLISCSYGDRTEYDGDANSLPYGHAARLRQNKQPETMLFTRKTRDVAISRSICSFNHITNEERDQIVHKNKSVYNEETGLGFTIMGGGPTLNLNSLEQIEETLNSLNGNEYIGTATHEQYFYPDYYAYQPDYAEKIYLLSRKMKEFGYRWVTADELK